MSFVKSNIYFIFILLSFSCKKHVSSVENKLHNDDFTSAYDFLKTYPLQKAPIQDSIFFLKPKDVNNDYLDMTLDEKKALKLDTILSFVQAGLKYYDYDKTHQSYNLSKDYALDEKLKIKALYRLDVSKNYKTLLLFNQHSNSGSFLSLINYSNDYKTIFDIKVIANYRLKFEAAFYVSTNEFNLKSYYYYDGKMVTKFTSYVIDKNGKIEFKENKYPIAQNTRAVKAKNGLIIRDALGNKIGKFDFGDAITVESYAEKDTTIIDNGKKIKGKLAKVILDYDAYLKQLLNPSIVYKVGYVFDGFLFNNEINEDEAYRYAGLSFNNKYVVPFNLKELFEIEQVKLDKYLNRIVKVPLIEDVTSLYKKNKLVTLKAENGKQSQFKDTTYQSEYSPTKTHNVLLDSNFKDRFIVGYHMIFSNQYYDFVSKTNGEILDTYIGGYPHVSPNKNYVVSIDYDMECPNERTLFLDKIVDGKIIKTIEIYYSLEDYLKLNFVKTTDKNEIYWLNNKEFIVNFWGATECYDNTENHFYYKYKIKEPLLELFDIK